MIRKLFRFIPNYLVLLIEVALGSHQTHHPLGVRWRWRHWRDNWSGVDMYLPTPLQKVLFWVLRTLRLD